MIPPPPRSTLFPYTTLFRSQRFQVRITPELPEGYPLRVGATASVAVYVRDGYWLNGVTRSEEHTSELQSHSDLVCRLLLEKKKTRSLTINLAASLASPPSPT